MTAETIRARDRRYVWHPWSPLSADRARLTISHGRGYRVWDINNKEYIDGCSLNSTCGYGRSEVMHAILQQMSELHAVDISVLSSEPVGRLAEKLASYFPDVLSKTLFVNSGSEGLEAAMMIAAAYWAHIGENRRRVITFSRGYHGSTLVSRSLTALPRVSHLFNPPMPVTYIQLPCVSRDARHDRSLPLLLAAFEEAIVSNGEDPPMAIVVEPFLNVGGGIVLPEHFLAGLRDMCDRHNTLLIVDEVFTAYGRCGHMFACQREGVTPDILISSKGLAGGYMPIAAVTVRQSIHDSFRNDTFIGGLRYGHTTSGHAVACAAALATLAVIETNNLLERARRLGRMLREQFATWTGKGDVVDVRGYGLILVVEMSSYRSATKVVEKAEALGLLLRQPGEALMLVPPLIIDEAGIAEACTRLHEALKS